MWSLASNVVKAGPEGEPEKALGHGPTRSNCSNRWLDRITVDPKCEAVDGWTGLTVRSGSYNTSYSIWMVMYNSESSIYREEH